MTSQPSSSMPVSPNQPVPYRFPKPPKPRKQPYRRPVDAAGYRVARDRTQALWEQLDDALARDKT